MTEHHDLLVIGAGPYGYAAAAYARERGIRTHVVGRPMSFWRQNMPADMFLRSGPDWHLDASGQDTFQAFFEDRGLRPQDHDPIPIRVFCDYTDWFRKRKGFEVDERLVGELSKPDGSFVARLEDGSTLTASGSWQHRESGTSPACRRGTTTCRPSDAHTPATSSRSTTSPARGSL